MARPRKSDSHDSDPYDEAALNLDETAMTPEPVFDPETDDILPELGETDRSDSFDSLEDDELFKDDRG